MMFGCDCFYWNQASDYNFPVDSEPFSLPAPIPQWPQGGGFATERISLGEIEVVKITRFESVWSCSLRGKKQMFTFYRPLGIPDGFHCLGYYCQPNDRPLRGYVLVARDRANTQNPEFCLVCDSKSDSPPLKKPLNYSLVWSSNSSHNGVGYFWLPNAPAGYRAMGIVVTDSPNEPDVEELRCVREDLTEKCETSDHIFSTDSKTFKDEFQVWTTRPCTRGMFATGVSVGTFYCGTFLGSQDDLIEVSCLKNFDCSLHGMPNTEQIHALIEHYGPTVYFHPDEEYLPSSVQWFFKNGAVLYQDGKQKGLSIDYEGAILPRGGENDGEYWIDLPEDDDASNNLKRGDMESAELYVHVKPALGGTFTDIVMWIFCPFNGPSTLKVGMMTIPLAKIGEHVGDWEHYTLRVSNFTGELWQVFFSEHSGGRWVDVSELEFKEGNRFIVYSSKHGHASYPHAGTYLQGSSKLGLGLRNDTGKSEYYVDSNTKYQLIAAEYLGGNSVLKEPYWLHYMREWGPTILYDSRSEVEKIINLLPFFFRFSVENIFDLFPTELYGEEGPTGPKEKDNWVLDEIC